MLVLSRYTVHVELPWPGSLSYSWLLPADYGEEQGLLYLHCSCGAVEDDVDTFCKSSKIHSI